MDHEEPAPAPDALSPAAPPPKTELVFDEPHVVMRHRRKAGAEIRVTRELSLSGERPPRRRIVRASIELTKPDRRPVVIGTIERRELAAIVNALRTILRDWRELERTPKPVSSSATDGGEP